MRRSANLFLVVLAAFCWLAFTRTTVFAAQVLTVSPTSTQPVISPGASYTGSMQAINQGSSAYGVTVYAAPYSVNSENYNPDFSPVPGRPNVTSWFHLSVSSGNLNPGQNLPVNYTINVPKNTQPGGYYAVIFANAKLPKSTQGVGINEQVGELFYIQVSGPVKESGSLVSWTSSGFQKPPLSTSIKLENTGGVYYISNIKVVVRDIFGTPKYTLVAQKAVLPQIIREVPIVWNHTPSLGLFKVNGTATIFGKTVNLPTKYVLVTSPAVRENTVIIVVIIIVLLVLRVVLKKRAAKHARITRN